MKIGSIETNKEIIIKQLSEKPSNPNEGFNKIYSKSDNKFYTLDSSGNEIEVGSGSSTPQQKYIYIPSSAMISNSTNGAIAGSMELSTNKIMLDYYEFDKDTDQSIQFSYVMPKDWDRNNVKIRFYWTATSGSGNVVFGIQSVAVSDDDTIDTNFGTVQIITDTFITANDLHISDQTSDLTIGGSPQENDLIIFRIYRDADNVNDTFDSSARLLGIQIEYTGLGDLALRDVGGEWELVERKEFTEPATSYTFSGLNGDVDIRYKIVGRVNEGGNFCNVVALFNNDNNLNYYLLHCGHYPTNNHIVVRQTFNGAVLHDETSRNGQVFEALIWAKSGVNRTCHVTNFRKDTSEIDTYMHRICNIIWNNSSSNITSITLFESHTRNWAVGTIFELWRLKPETKNVSLMTWNIITTDTNASKDKGYFIDASSNAINITLPANPKIGDTINFKIINKTNTITILRNGNKIEGQEENLVLGIDKVGLIFVYSNANYGWTIINN